MSASAIASLAALPAHARVWVYKSEVPLGIERRAMVLERGRAFTGGWAAHGAPLDAAVDVLHDRFVVIGVDEEQARASGCSIDKSVRFVQELERDLGLRLTDRMVVLYERDGTVQACRVPEIEGLLKSGVLTADTIVFDDLVGTKGDLDARFRVPLRSSWMARYL